MKKAEVIQKVEESVGSLFTKDDVISLINSIDSDTNEIDFQDLFLRIEAIIDDANTNDIEIDTSDCEFEISDSNRVEICESSVTLDVDSYIDSIKHDIQELINATERGEACQVEEEEEEEDCQ